MHSLEHRPAAGEWNPFRSAFRSAGGAALALLAGALLSLTACTYSGGELLFMLGLGRGELIEAKFRLTDKPIVILVDDDNDLVDWPAAKYRLADSLAQELLKNEAAAKIVPQATVQRMRQADMEFDSMPCDVAGRRAGAEQVIWLKVEEFIAREDVRDIGKAAVFTVSVKVINTQAKQRADVRLWPKGREGQFCSVDLTASEVSVEKTKDAISRKLADELAVRVAKLFYDHRLGEFEKEE
jgi:hypothetical protein